MVLDAPKWQFRKMGKGEMNVDPIEGEFFSTEALGSLSDALIREAIQNSLDAAMPDEKVKIAISFSAKDQNLPASSTVSYLKGLKGHLAAKESGIIEPVDLDSPMDFMVIEDFGTRGLEGDIREDEDKRTRGPKNHFFYFWRNIGRSVEGATARGRWGLGKTVFQAASRINSFFGLTIRRGDNQKLLMGQSVLKIHRCDGAKHAPYGYYGVFEGDFALPFADEKIIEQFSSDFNLRRDGESGLSVIIPFPDEDITPDEIMRAVISQYFFPILSGDLVVSISDRHNEKVLDSESIFRFVSIREFPNKEMAVRRLNFAKWCIDLPIEKYTLLKEPATGKAPAWDENLFEAEQLNYLRKRFDDEERIALRAPLWVRKDGEDIQHSFFKIFLERDEALERGEDFFIRDGVTLMGVSSLRQKGVRAVVAVSDKPLSRLLGDSENPAHTEWQERSPKFKGRYDHGVSCLRFVKSSTREIVKLLSRPSEERDIKLLRNLFYLDVRAHNENTGISGKPNEKPGDDGNGTSEPGSMAADRFLVLHRTKQGFRLSARPEARKLPKEIDIEVAYDVRQGNPFKLYSHFDFELNKPPIRASGKGIKASISKSNIIHIVIERPDFQLLLTGFDPKRDLKIRTSTSLDANL
ncbi:MAG: hypothetical protein JW944_09125 [Deltaproteobacteria bacterium]|nr:hypothetical protein [Deltaproteobacteria bacterium]